MESLDNNSQNPRPIFADKSSFEELFRTYYHPLFKIVLPIVKNSDVAEDIVQGLFVKLWQKKDSLVVNGPVRYYLNRAAANAAFDHLDKYKREVKYENKEDFENEFVANDTDKHLEQKELELHVSQAIDKLPTACRNIYLLSRNEELSYKEIAETLQISIKTVENQMGKALKVLRQELGPYIKGMIKIFVFYLFY